MDHLQRVQQEFTRQANQFATAAAVTHRDLVQRFVDAVPEDTGATILDVACGPGIITVNLALVRLFRLTERLKLETRFEAFNANHDVNYRFCREAAYRRAANMFNCSCNPIFNRFG